MSKHKALSPEGAKVRLDKWLWAARFFKTRGLASEAIAGGHVYLNGSRAKASRCIQPGDEVRIRKAHQEWVLVAQALSEQRRPAYEAQALYEETAQSRTLREEKAENNRLLSTQGPAAGSRANKRNRRQIRRLTERSF